MDVQIVNPEFNPPYTQQDGDKHLHLAQGWRAWWSTEKADDSHGGSHHRPEYYQKRYGDQDALSCQAWQTTHATHRAGVYQVIALPAGVQELYAAIDARYYAQDEQGRLGELALRLGLLDGEGSDGTDPAIVWGEWRGQTDKTGWKGDTWEPLTVQLFNCMGLEQATLFVESRCRWPVRNNHAFVQDAHLVATVAGEPGTDPDPWSAEAIALLSEIRDLVARIAEACNR